jgi:FHA domain/zinc-ribbon domain
MPHVYCPECGFQNPEAANFCSKCGAALVRDPGGGDTTQVFTPDQVDEASPLEDLGMEGPALVVRSGGGRAGEHFTPRNERTTIGRSPDCDIFLDDVTVSRKHAVLLRQGRAFRIEDQGSLNGTFVNRRRIDSAELADGDEVQIGKYRLTFLEGADSPAPTRRGGGGATAPPQQ